MTRVVIIGGGPGGYEAALVGAQLGADVTIVDRDGIGGSAVLTDCVPSKTLIATAEVMTSVAGVGRARRAVRSRRDDESPATDGGSVGRVDLAAVNAAGQEARRAAQSRTSRGGSTSEGVRIVHGTGRLDGPETVVATTEDGEERLAADAVLISTGAHPRMLPTATPDGERILTWEQVYDLDEFPSERLIVIGSGVTGAEFASAYNALGVDVVLVSSRDRVLPGEDAEAAEVLEDVLKRRGMTVLTRSRAQDVVRDGDQRRSSP